MDVISIGGSSRSGSTLLALLLGQVDDHFSVGELHYIWSRGYTQNMLCGCGEPFNTCAFWQSVLEEAYGSPSQVPIDEITALHASVAKVWRLPELISPLRRAAFEREVQSYLPHIERLMRAILEVSGAKTIVDSSKYPSYCYLLSLLPNANVQLLHLVRDSRAVAYSFMRTKRKPDIHWKEEYMTRFSPLRSARDWTVFNLGMELINATRVPCDFVRYEDLVADPHRELVRMLPSLSGPSGDFLKFDRIPLRVNHTVSGNPLRFESNGLHIRPDTEWQSRMKPKQRQLVTTTTWPLLVRYGYAGPRTDPNSSKSGPTFRRHSQRKSMPAN
jgi:Sulfotransferase family